MEEKKTYKNGLWTPWGQVICFDHIENQELPVPLSAEDWKSATMPRELSEKNAVTCCDSCKAEVQVARNIANEHNLVQILRDRGIDAYMAQTGGMNSACAIAVPETEHAEDEVGVPDEILVVYDSYGTDHYVLGIYSDCSPAEVDEAEMEFETLEDLLAWIDANPDKMAHLEEAKAPPDYGKQFEEALKNAKAKATEKIAGREPKPPPKKGLER